MAFTPIWAQNFEGGSDGTTIAPANTATGTNADSATGTNVALSRHGSSDIGTGNISTFYATNPLNGSLSHRFKQNDTTRMLAFVAFAQTYTDISWRYRFTFSAAPGTSFYHTRWFGDTAYGAGVITMTPSTQLTSSRIYGNGSSQSGTSTGSLTPGSQYIQVGSWSAASATFTIDYFPVGSTTSAMTVTAPTSVGTVGSFQYGVGQTSGASTGGIDIIYDDFLVGYGGIAPRNDIAANQPPAVAIINSQTKQVGQTTTVTAVGSDPDGTVASYLWTVESFPGSTAPALTNTTSATVSVGALPTAGTVVLGVVARDNAGANSPKRTMSILVTAAAGSTVPVDKVVSNAGAYTAGGTATSVADGFTAAGKYALSPSSAQGASITVGFPPMPSTDVTIDFYVDLVKADGTTLADASQTGTINAQFFAGTTAITGVVPTTVSATEAHVVIVLTSSQNTAFTTAGRTDPRVVLTGTSN